LSTFMATFRFGAEGRTIWMATKRILTA
jgi:hypothetical protein